MIASPIALDPMYPTLASTVGNTPLVRLQRLPGATSNVILGKLEGNNPGGLGEGSPCAVDDRGSREARRHQARRHADRGDVGQHRHRARDGRRDEGLPDDPGDARQPVARAAAIDARVRRRARADAEGRRHGERARRRGADARRRQGHHPRPVRQSRQSARALPRHRARRSGATRTARSRISCRRWARPARSWACRVS